MTKKVRKNAEVERLIESGESKLAGVAEAMELYLVTEQVYIAANQTAETTTTTSTNTAVLRWSS